MKTRKLKTIRQLQTELDSEKVRIESTGYSQQFIVVYRVRNSRQPISRIEHFSNLSELLGTVGNENRTVLREWYAEHYQHPQCVLCDIEDKPSAVVYIVGRINDTE